ncbi:hypothetical protein C8K36_1011303 [Rhodococcus sp. OK519]|uniref:hypothetical protein n=1 Tax=Rhodococcus sp. OK519 TaxID=2135729 RepID=UPI000D35B697|nr:hypothetical protein C8K36_1011303 [Rhodococcus sp. OK519]
MVAITCGAFAPDAPAFAAETATAISLPPELTVTSLTRSEDAFGPVVISGCLPNSAAQLEVSLEVPVAAGFDPISVPVLFAPNLAIDAEGYNSSTAVLPAVTDWLQQFPPAPFSQLRFTATCRHPTLSAAVWVVPYQPPVVGANPPTPVPAPQPFSVAWNSSAG